MTIESCSIFIFILLLLHFSLYHSFPSLSLILSISFLLHHLFVYLFPFMNYDVWTMLSNCQHKLKWAMFLLMFWWKIWLALFDRKHAHQPTYFSFQSSFFLVWCLVFILSKLKPATQDGPDWKKKTKINWKWIKRHSNVHWHESHQ